MSHLIGGKHVSKTLVVVLNEIEQNRYNIDKIDEIQLFYDLLTIHMISSNLARRI